MTGRPPFNAELHIAAGDSADLDDVMSVMTKAFERQFGEAWTRSQCAGILPMSGVSLMVARTSEGKPLGFSLFRSVADEAELLLLAVVPECQGQGIGRCLLEEFMSQAHRDGANRVHLEVREGNPAVNMYQAAGFKAAGRRRNYYHGSEGECFDALTLDRCL